MSRFALALCSLLTLAPSTHAQESARAGSGQAPLGLFSLAGSTAGRALPGPSRARASQGAGKAERALGRVSALSAPSFSALGRARRGTSVSLPLYAGRSVRGRVSFAGSQNGVLRVGGSLTDARGSFSFSVGKGRISGHVLLDEASTAFRIESASAARSGAASRERDANVGASSAGEVVLAERDLSAVLCYPQPQARGGAGAQAGAQVSGEEPRVRAAAPPILNSRPGASAVIYLDFDGEIVNDPAWNNGNPFQVREVVVSTGAITTVFNVVAEDFAPFNINVTTDLGRYNAAPVNRRTRCLIGNTPPGFFDNAGGVAYINAFSLAGSAFSDTIPCFAFPNRLANFPRFIGNTVSHEVGHTLGLFHDGTRSGEEYYPGNRGPVGWSPIMGSYFDFDLVQFSKGEYADANNFQDDLADISRPANGFGYAADEAGETIGTAAPITTAGSAINQAGVIQRTGDVDVYSFTSAGGRLSFSLVGAPITPNSNPTNLNAQLEVLDSQGNVLGISNPGERLSASLTLSLSPGFYFVRAQGVGSADPRTTGFSNYGSLGAYTITGNVPAEPPIARDDSYTIAPDSQVSGNVLENDDDPQGDLLSVALGQNVTNGTLALEPDGDFTYTPAAGFLGTDSFTYTATDGSTVSSPATVTLNVTEVGSLVVTTTADNRINDRLISLREAIGYASTLDGQPEITFALPGAVPAGGHVIGLDPDLGALEMDSNITITGPGAGLLSISGGNATRIFSITRGDVRISGLSIVGGDPGEEDEEDGEGGGGVRVGGGSLTMTACVLRNNNTGVRIEAGAVLALLNSTIRDNTGTSGGGVFNNGGSMTVSNCTFSGNSAVNGGAIFSQGAAASSVSSSTFSRNSALEDGGALFVADASPLALVNSIVADNDAATLPDIRGTLAANTTNIIGGTAVAAGLATAADGSPILADNGGPTPTIALLVTSPAVNTGTNAGAAATDQRGLPRVRGGAIDIGAFEVQNDRPSLSSFTLSVLEDGQGALAASLNGAFTDSGDSLSRVRITRLPQAGELRLNGAAVVAGQEVVAADLAQLFYVPTANFFGADTFAFNAADSSGLFGVAEVNATLQVLAVNDAPSFTIRSEISVAEDADEQSVPSFATGIVAGPSNEGSQVFSFALSNSNPELFSAQPTLGANGVLGFTPRPNANGSATVSVTLRDSGGTQSGGSDTSAVATFTIVVQPVNDAPFAQGQTVGTPEDTPLDITLSATDIDSSAFTFAIVQAPRNGTLSPSGATLRYTPRADFTGADAFSFRASDGSAESNPAIVSITVGGANDAPVAVADAASTSEDRPATLQVLANHRDADGDALRIVRVATTSATNGTVSINADNTLRFVPFANFSGTARFSYTISDGALESSAVVTVQVLAGGDALIARDDAASTSPGVALTVQVLANDTDADGLTIRVSAVSNAGTRGVASIVAGGQSVLFTPEAGFTGTTSFGYTASDGTSTSSARVTVQVLAGLGAPQANRVPATVADSYSVTTGPLQVLAARGVLANDTDADGDTLVAVLNSVPAHGTIVFRADGSFTYTPSPTYTGRDSFSYKARDGKGESVVTQVTLQVVASRDTTPPVVNLAGGAELRAPRLLGARGSSADVYVVRGKGTVASSGLRDVVLQLQRADGQYWNGTAFQEAPFDLATRRSGRSFSLQTDDLPPSQAGDRFVWTAIARDNAGNTSRDTQAVLIVSAPGV